MSQTRSPMSLYEYLSIKLKELTALFPCTVQACPALKLIKNLLATVEHESIAPDYDESTKQQFREICAELHQMIVATELIVSPSQKKLENPEKCLYETAEKLVDFIEGHLTPLVKATILEAEKESGKPMAICIIPYKPWDTPINPIYDLYRKSLAPFKEEPMLAGVAHTCENRNSQAWPNCCAKSSAPFFRPLNIKNGQF